MTSAPTNRIESLPRGRHGLSREEVRESQRQRILIGMTEVVSEFGYGESRVADAISVAGVSRKTFYELFADKEDCFLAAYDHWVKQMLRATVDGFEHPKDATWEQRIVHATHALLRFIADNPAAGRLLIVEVMAAGPEGLARRDAALRRLSELLDQGRTEHSQGLPGITAFALTGGVLEMIHSELLHGAASMLPERLPDIAYWVIQPYRGEDVAATARDYARELVASS